MTNWSTVLHNQGYKATPARLLLLHLLDQAKKPLSVQRILHLVARDTIDQATIYRTMAALKASGIIRQIDFQHGHAHYELANLGDHHHVVCLKCEVVEDVFSCDLQDMTHQALQQSGFAEIREHSLEFFGICQNCRPS